METILLMLKYFAIAAGCLIGTVFLIFALIVIVIVLSMSKEYQDGTYMHE